MSKKIFFKGVSYSYLRQIIVLITGVISLPLLLSYLGTISYGIWVLIIGLVGYLNTISFGIPSAMMTLVAKTSDLKEKYNILKKSFYILSILALGVSVLFIFMLYLNDDWIITLLGNIDNELVSITKIIFILFVFFTLIKLPLNLYMQFFTGMNIIYISEIYQIFIILINFVSILIAVFFNLEILNFVMLWLIGQLLINIISVIHVVLKFKYLNNEIIIENNVSYSDILKSGFAFFQVGIAATIVWSTDNLIISHVLSPEYVTAYSISFKIFTYLFMFSAIFNGVIGPMYGNAYANNDWTSIQKYTSIIHKLLPVIGAVVWIFLIFFTKEIIVLWTGDEKVFGGYLLIFSLGLYGYILSFINTYATLIFSLNYTNRALKIAWAEAILNFLFSMILITYLGIGGVALATAISALLSGFIFLPKLIKELTNERIIYNFSYTKKHFTLLVVPSILVSIFIIDFNLVTKITVFIFISIIYTIFSWKLLSLEDRLVFYKLIKRKGK